MTPQERAREYADRPLNKASVDPDPMHQFDRWLGEATRAGLPEPTAMTLATAGPGGMPSARLLLLKGHGPGGFVFYTNYRSRKARELDANPQAALVFFWVELGRQVRIEGRAGRIARADSSAYFAGRPRESRLSAVASRQSEVVGSRHELESRLEAVRASHRHGDVPCPEFWGGYRLVPEAIEFWQGRSNRFHDRIRYRRDAGGGWVLERLEP